VNRNERSLGRLDNEPVFGLVHAVSKRLKRVARLERNLSGCNHGTDIDPIVRHPVHHYTRRSDLTRGPSLERPLNRMRTGERTWLRRMQIHDWECGANVGPQDPHPASKHNQIGLIGRNHLDQILVGSPSLMRLGSTVLNNQAVNVSRSRTGEHARISLVRDYADDLGIEITARAGIDERLAIRAAAGSQDDDAATGRTRH